MFSYFSIVFLTIEDQSKSFSIASLAFFDFVTEVCSGKKTRSELLDKTELAIFKDGVTL